MTTKLELHNVAISTTSIELDEDNRGQIPPNLAKLTDTILKIHKVNGDLAWVGDMTADMELEADVGMNISGLSPHSLVCIANGLSKAHDDAEDTSDEKLEIFKRFSQITEEITSLMGRDWMIENVIAIK